MKLRVSTKQLLFILVAVVCILYAILNWSGQKFVMRMLNLTENFSEVENANSVLLPLLLQKDDFSKDWQWDLIITHQGNMDPLREENRIIEFSRRQFAGLYKEHSVRIIHSVYRYEADITLLDININPSLESIGLNDVIEKFTFSLPGASNGETISCYYGIDNRQNSVSRCILTVQHTNILERIDIDLYHDMPKELIKQATITIQSYLQSRNLPK